MSNIKVGQTIRVTARFVDFDPYAGTDDLLDPSSVSAALYQYNSTTSTFDLIGLLSPVVRESLGVYYVDWQTTGNGLFRVLLVGTLDDATPNTIENPRDFYVGTAEPTTILGSNLEYGFLGELSPLYLDPERILDFWPDADLVEVTTIIYRLSGTLDTWFGPGAYLITPDMDSWLLAATMCELVTRYMMDGGLNGFNDPGGFTLGDLQVQASQANSGAGFDDGLPSTWCEMALMFKNALLFTRTGIKAVMRGSNYCNPIPSRRLRRFER